MQSILLPLDKIVIDPAFQPKRHFQPDEKYIQKLADSIKQQGLMMSLMVCRRYAMRKDKKGKVHRKLQYVLLHGFLRVKALRTLPKEHWEKIPCQLTTHKQYSGNVRVMDI